MRRHHSVELALELARPRRANPLLAAYRWRYEIAAAVLVPVALIELLHLIGPIWVLVGALGLVSMVWHWPAARRFVTARCRAIVVQHRLRTAFARARVCTLDGRLPAILWTTPGHDETQVLVACPAGIGIERFHDRRDLLASACFSNEVTVHRHPRFANLIVLSVHTD